MALAERTSKSPRSLVLEYRAYRVREPPHIELRTRPVVLPRVGVLIVVGRRRDRTIPLGVRTIDGKDPGTRAGEIQHLVEWTDDGAMLVPVLHGARVCHETRDSLDVLLARPIARHPDDVRPQIRVVDLGK